MDPLPVPTARRVSSLGSALLLTLVMVAAVSAKDDASPSTESVTSPGTADAGISLAVGPWHLATIDDAPKGSFVRGITASESGLLALGNREFVGPSKPLAWVSDDALSWERASFAKGARRGLIEAAVATPDGWVAVGRSFPEQAYAWTSPDGREWQAAKRIESAAGHILYDIAATSQGLIAVGCEAEFHCRVGKAWTSKDGRTWKLLSELPIQLPRAVETIGDTIVVAGFSNGVETNLSQAVTATSKTGRAWELSETTGPQGSGFHDLVARTDEIFAYGWQQGVRADEDRAILQRSRDGRTWSSVAPAELEGWGGIAAAASDDLLLLTGTRSVENEFIAPTTYSSPDQESWAPGTFSEGLRAETYHVSDSTFSFDGDKVLMTGAIDYGPAIWWADVAPVDSPLVEPAPVMAVGPVTPDRFEAAAVPEGDAGVAVMSVIPGGPGYIAVGGGSSDGAGAQALVWTSAAGLTWETATMAEDASDGVIEAVAPLPGGGYVAVGNDSTSAQALVWHSPDGTSWDHVEPPQSFAGAVIHDLAVTLEGVVAVGCEAYPDCRTGLVWTSSDGLHWELGEELALTPFATTALGQSITAGGTDSGKPDEGQAVIASADETGWGTTEPLGRASSRIVAMDSDEEGIVAVGWEQRPGKAVESALFVSRDGQSWDPVTHKRLRGVTASALGLSDDGVLVVGAKADKKQGATPLAFWSRDLEDFETIRFPKDVELDGLTIEGGGMAADGSMAFAVGTDGDRPAIWYSLIE